jgi:hypothetical protein
MVAECAGDAAAASETAMIPHVQTVEDNLIVFISDLIVLIIL